MKFQPTFSVSFQGDGNVIFMTKLVSEEAKNKFNGSYLLAAANILAKAKLGKTIEGYEGIDLSHLDSFNISGEVNIENNN